MIRQGHLNTEQFCSTLALMDLYKQKLTKACSRSLGEQLGPSLTLIVVSGRFKAAASSHLRGLDT